METGERDTGEKRGPLGAFHEKKTEVTSALQELGAVAGSLGANTLRERIGRDLVRKLEEDRFHLVVVGEFNHGKSTFVNALLGRPQLPGAAALLRRGSLSGLVLVAETEGVRAVLLGPDGAAEDLGLTTLGTSFEGIAGAVGVQP